MEQENSAASASNGEMEKVSSVEGNKEESLQKMAETSASTAVSTSAEECDEEEKMEVKGDRETDEEEDETGEDEENDGESKTKKCLGHWESEVRMLRNFLNSFKNIRK